MKQYTKARLEGTIDVGARTCRWKADCKVSRWTPLKDPLMGGERPPEFVEFNDLDLKIEVFNDAGTEKFGEYEGAEIPDAERKYWERYVEKLCVLKVERSEGVDEFNWEEGEL